MQILYILADDAIINDEVDSQSVCYIRNCSWVNKTIHHRFPFLIHYCHNIRYTQRLAYQVRYPCARQPYTVRRRYCFWRSYRRCRYRRGRYRCRTYPRRRCIYRYRTFYRTRYCYRTKYRTVYRYRCVRRIKRIYRYRYIRTRRYICRYTLNN